MNDEHEPDDVTPDPERDERIRALLAELGSGPDGEPMPPEVEARLDDTLALLVAQRAGNGTARPDEDGEDESTSNVVPLRRRWLPRAAAAAAAVIVLGVGGFAVGSSGLFDRSSPSGSSADSAGGSADEAPKSGSESGSGSDSSTEAAALPELSSSSFPSDVSRLVKGGAGVLTPEDKVQDKAQDKAQDEAPDKAAGQSQGDTAGEQSPEKRRQNAKSAAPEALASQACPGPTPTDGAVPNQVRYDGQRAVLLIHPERAGQQVVEAWSCDGDRRLATTTVTP